MYGLLLECLEAYITEQYGRDMWLKVRERAAVPRTFTTHQIYSEMAVPRIARALSDLNSKPYDEIMEELGKNFVNFVGRYGYDMILKVLGRHMRDFLNGLDNLHEYLRFSYPKLRAPSFFCDNETEHGLQLHYRSSRKGYVSYVIGQIKQVGKIFYNTEVKVEVVDKKEHQDGSSVIFQLHFDNQAYSRKKYQILKPKRSVSALSIESKSSNQIRSDVLFEIFPFHLVLNKDMEVIGVGKSLNAILPDLLGKQAADVFTLTRPMINFDWMSVMNHTNVVFEISSVVPAKVIVDDPFGNGQHYDNDVNEEAKIHLKGQMVMMEDWNALMYLSTPIIENLDMMFNTGLYINDLSMHDSSRDLVLAGTQQSAELKLALDQELHKSAKLEESMRELENEKKKTDTLLYQMIPRSVAERLRKGEPSMTTCETFQHVTILFSDVVGFTSICSKITPMQVVTMLNNMYTAFDKLSEDHKVYKVETIGDAYMVVSGLPERTKKHADDIANMALGMLEAMPQINDPSSSSAHLMIRAGVHSGSVVAGVVGLKMPRYCLFGDTVNTASRMESTGLAMSVHVSETTKDYLLPDVYRLKQRGSISVKGKGEMKTYWLLGRIDGGEYFDNDQLPGEPPKCPFQQVFEQSKNDLSKEDNSPINNNNNIKRRPSSAPANKPSVTSFFPNSEAPIHEKESGVVSYYGHENHVIEPEEKVDTNAKVNEDAAESMDPSVSSKSHVMNTTNKGTILTTTCALL